MSLNFNIPADRKDLLDVDNSYCLTENYSKADLSSDFKDLTSAFGHSDISDYLEKFLHVFYYVTEHINGLEWKLISYYFDVLKKVWCQLNTKLDLHFNKKLFDKQEILNDTKIILFITNEFIYACDKKIDDNSAGKTKKKLKKQACTIADLHYSTWAEIKKQVLFFMFKVSTYPLPLLYNPPLPEEQFTDLISDSCYSTMKDNTYLKESGIRDTVFQIIGNLIKHYNHSNSFIVKFVHVVKNTEPSQQTPIVLGVIQLKEDYELHSLVVNISKEILTLAGKETSTEAVELKNFMNFLTELSSNLPQTMIPVTNLLEGLENFEIPVIRLCFCSMVGEILLKFLNREGLSPENKDLRDSYLIDIYETIHDISAVVRSKVLQIFTRLLKETSLPISWKIKIMSRAVGRLVDRATMVRKNAIVLLKEFLSHKPVDSSLDPKILQQHINEEIAKLNQLNLELYKGNEKNAEIWNEKRANFLLYLKDAFSTEASIEVFESMESEEEDDELMVNNIVKSFREEKFDDVIKYTIFMEKKVEDGAKERRKLSLKDLPKYFYVVVNRLICRPDNRGSTSTDINAYDMRKKIEEQEEVINCLGDSLRFSEVISSAIPLIQAMLYSKAVNDTNEAIDFFASAVHLGIDSAYDGILHLLYLLVTQKENKDVVYKTLTNICIGENSCSGERSEAVRTLKKLCFLIEKMSMSHEDPFSLLIKYWLEKNMFTPTLIQVCWERVTRKLEDTTDSESISCLIILSLAAKYKPNIVWTNIKVVESLLADFETKNINILIQVFKMLRNMWMSQKSISSTTNVMASRFPKDHDIFLKIVSMILHYCENASITVFRRICKYGIEVIYAGSDVPSETIEKLISKMIPEADQTMKTSQISRVLYAVSVAALNHLSFVDVTVYSELKYRKERKNMSKNCETPAHDYSKRSNLESASKNLKDKANRTNNNGTELDEDTEQKLWAATEDLEANFVNHICEKELVEPPSSFNVICCYVIEILRNRNEFDDMNIQIDATAALISFMLISSITCAKNMQLLMSTLRFTKYPDVKCNIIVGMADLLVRFPNEAAPWEHHIFERLNDSNMDVRKVALKFGCQLILTNSIRAKSHISDVALFLVDDDMVLKNLAIHFFKEISSKELYLYNALPDIISKLTNPTLNINETKFQIIIRMILKHIHKDRHMDGLIVKICLRLQVSTNETQLKNLAFCLSLINYTEKSIQVLINNFQCYKERLNDPDIRKIFRDITNVATKASVKPELKTLCAELDSKIDSLFELNTEKNNDKSIKKPNTKPHRRQTHRSQNISSSDDDDDDEIFVNPANKSDKNSDVRRSTRLTTTNGHRTLTESFSDDPDDRNTKKNRRLS